MMSKFGYLWEWLYSMLQRRMMVFKSAWTKSSHICLFKFLMMSLFSYIKLSGPLSYMLCWQISYFQISLLSSIIIIFLIILLSCNNKENLEKKTPYALTFFTAWKSRLLGFFSLGQLSSDIPGVIGKITIFWSL